MTTTGACSTKASATSKAPPYRRHYTYDKSGNLTRLLDTRKGDHRYQYDPLARLTHADHSQDEQERFSHTPAGNALMHDRSGPDIVAGNRLAIQGDHHYDYDAFGNLIQERRGREHRLVTEYHYDCQHRLIGITHPTLINRVKITDQKQYTEGRVYTLELKERRIEILEHSRGHKKGNLGPHFNTEVRINEKSVPLRNYTDNHSYFKR